MKYLLIVSIYFAFVSCQQQVTKQEGEISIKINKNDNVIPEVADWADDYIGQYLDESENNLINIEGYPITYMKRVDYRNGRTFAIVNIGHNFDDRFVSDQMIYIDSLTKVIYNYEPVTDSLIIWKKVTAMNMDSTEMLPDGKYRFDIAFAEWEGKSMGEKVTVIIKGESIKVVYEGDGQLTLTEKGEVIDEGEIMMHDSGVWIIGNSLSDRKIKEIGGCSGGPTIIDFKNKKYWLC
ncbi:hypothetical protein DNU06_09155 [Putridiphycobacter roseus]|uniref:Uncharacterized protein n=1 Tax=Putridiphycobacter roseus TaxID=2219161 RepID=A0A2W1NS04_9FLAO|nr:hypothetical protein [Putridiphycobacter roseus]PZE17428.1 hypothetical protein DNU06_09155 [Putridiphycobacter roseus]